MYRYSKNIYIHYIFTLFFNLDLTRGLWMIYLAAKGFTLMQLGILEGCFHVTSFLMEVPTGAVADVWGRKQSRILGRICFLLSLFFMYFSETYLFQLIGFCICAIGYNLESGAGDALLYDSLLLDARSEDFMKTQGVKELIYKGATVIAYVTGGWLAVTSYPIVFYISFGIALLSALIGLGFIEPEIVKTQNKFSTHGLLSQVIGSIKIQTLDSLHVIRWKPKIALLILFSELLFTFMTCLFFYLQNFWYLQGKNEFYIGTIFAIGSIISGITGVRAASIEQRIGEKGVLLIMPLLLLFCLWGVAFSPYPHIFYLITGIIEGILIVAISDYINRLIPSQNRATILSFQSMTFSFFMIILFPTVGWIGDSFSLRAAFLSMALLGSVIWLVYFFYSKKIFSK